MAHFQSAKWFKKPSKETSILSLGEPRADKVKTLVEELEQENKYLTDKVNDMSDELSRMREGFEHLLAKWSHDQHTYDRKIATRIELLQRLALTHKELVSIRQMIQTNIFDKDIDKLSGKLARQKSEVEDFVKEAKKLSKNGNLPGGGQKYAVEEDRYQPRFDLPPTRPPPSRPPLKITYDAEDESKNRNPFYVDNNNYRQITYPVDDNYEYGRRDDQGWDETDFDRLNNEDF